MSPEYIQLGAVFILAMSLIELCKFLISRYTSGKKANFNGATEVLQRIQGNDLLHIGEGIKRQSDILTHHSLQNETIIALLIEINTRLKLNGKE